MYKCTTVVYRCTEPVISHLQYPVPPEHVDVAGEHVGGPVGGGHGDHGLGLGVLEGRLPLQPEADRHGEVGLLGLVLLDGGGIVMEGFPLRTVSVPVESRGGNVHIEVVPDLVQHLVERGAVFGPLRPVIGDEV